MLVCWCFQALQYLRKLCNHPALVLTPQHPEYKHITEQLSSQHSNLRDIQHAPKLSALKQVPSVFIVHFNVYLVCAWGGSILMVWRVFSYSFAFKICN